MARVDQAEAGAKYARSFLFPTISLGAAASRTREAQNRPNNGNTGGRGGDLQRFSIAGFPQLRDRCVGPRAPLDRIRQCNGTGDRGRFAICASRRRSQRGDGLLQPARNRCRTAGARLHGAANAKRGGFDHEPFSRRADQRTGSETGPDAVKPDAGTGAGAGRPACSTGARDRGAGRKGCVGFLSSAQPV